MWKRCGNDVHCSLGVFLPNLFFFSSSFHLNVCSITPLQLKGDMPRPSHCHRSKLTEQNIHFCERTETQRSSFCMLRCECKKCFLHATDKILKNGRKDFRQKTILLFVCPESISKINRPDPTMTFFDGLYLCP